MKRVNRSLGSGWHPYRRWGMVVLFCVVLFIAYAKLMNRAPAPAVVGLSLDGLVDERGVTLDDATLRGRYQLLSFGYTQCPDACPATLMKVRSLMAALAPSANIVAPVFVSVDPEHDSPDLLGRYVHAFDSRILAVTGSRARIDAYAKSYGALGIRPPDAVQSTHASHAVRLYLVAPTREILATYDLETPTPLIANDIQRRIATGESSGLAANHSNHEGHTG
ncbi:MAG: SCO family protein [Proteobacteria bacterium]|nr:SCO family protein [Pseudomonadota bacterium]